jgi:hypothetical protein
MDQPFKPIDPTFNTAVLHMAALKWPHGYDAGEVAPNSLAELNHMLDTRGRLTVWDGDCEPTIYADHAVNLAFRAWHEWHHWRGQIPFTREGERQVYLRQLQDLVDEYGPSQRLGNWGALLDAEINGNARYLSIHGRFPSNQRAFALHYLINSDRAVHREF